MGFSDALFLEPSSPGHLNMLFQSTLQAVKEVLFITKSGPVCPFFLLSKSIISPKGTFCVGRRKENGVGVGGEGNDTIVPFTKNFCKPEEGEIWR